MPDIQQKFIQVTVRIQRVELPDKTVSKLYHFQARPRAILPNFGFGMRKFAYHREENASTSKHHRHIESSCLVLMALNIFPWVQLLPVASCTTSAKNATFPGVSDRRECGCASPEGHFRNVSYRFLSLTCEGLENSSRDELSLSA